MELCPSVVRPKNLQQDTEEFWSEEIRNFPHGGGAAAMWVVRRESADPMAPLTVLFDWACGTARRQGMAQRMPLSALMKSMLERREALVNKSSDSALWVEPLLASGEVKGCLGIWFQAEERWRESIFLWGQRLGARLAPVMGTLEPMNVGPQLSQPTLFPVGDFQKSTGLGVSVRKKSHSARSAVGGPSNPWSRDLLLPRPMPIPGLPGCVGVSQEMMELGRRLPSIATSGVNVLVRGESGTGKEIVARSLHLASDRAKGPFVGQNCAALPESLFESELFGHKGGAFTGATGDKQGLLSAANGGTFFLDEIGDMPLALQIKLLRVMQERRVRRIGDVQSRPVDIRFVAATHKNLEAEITSGSFRLDLFYRLKVVSIEIPPLRHRPEDVASLFSLFLKKAGLENKDMRITERALACLQAWSWPGNVRELENEVQRFVALYRDVTTIRVDHLSPEIQSSREKKTGAGDLGTLRELSQANEILERYLIRKAIAASAGQKAAAARRLGLSRQGLYKKIQRYEMNDLIGGN
ncbi:MAG: transcriptional regulator with AAA-type ATPase domain [Candidatus Krumholzibacteriia bacterium]|jgi:transcriptional regulator with AAA-type ATPase domain